MPEKNNVSVGPALSRYSNASSRPSVLPSSYFPPSFKAQAAEAGKSITSMRLNASPVKTRERGNPGPPLCPLRPLTASRHRPARLRPSAWPVGLHVANPGEATDNPVRRMNQSRYRRCSLVSNWLARVQPVSPHREKRGSQVKAFTKQQALGDSSDFAWRGKAWDYAPPVPYRRAVGGWKPCMRQPHSSSPQAPPPRCPSGGL